MKRNVLPIVGGWIILSALPAILLASVRWHSGSRPFQAHLATCWGFTSSILVFTFLAVLLLPWRRMASWPVIGLVALALGTGLLYWRLRSTWAAWVMLGMVYSALLQLEAPLTAGLAWLPAWMWRGVLAIAAGLFPVWVAQIESHFADEEFFAALQVPILSAFWLLLLLARVTLERSAGLSRGAPNDVRPVRRWLTVGLAVVAALGLGITVRAYQRSFYPPEAPSYPGISEDNPFICGETLPDSQIFDGVDVFRRLLARVEANSQAGAPEYGMLALGTGEEQWAQAFRQSLLQEAAEGRFTGPAHSVKSVQFEAALRAYYFPRVQAAFPDLFSEAETRQVREWFAAINRRALTVEWVDLMYALAFSKWPEGPYENQENGAGLLALLEAEGLAAPELSAANRDYLARNRRGWDARFCVTDDAFIYQSEWITNAYFQSLYTGEANPTNLRLSMEWLLLQTLPDGSSLRYNHPGRASQTGIAYAGAGWLGDPRYVWLAGRALENAEKEGRVLFAQPGAETPLSLRGVSPTVGSCLLYGDSGLPNQRGPLAPDKIVFRDGWSSDSAYLLLNLRFSGWHRYKATGTISLVYQNGPLAGEVLDGRPFSWLPMGRSLFRDKRIPRENLNGLVVERVGMEEVLYRLTGFDGPWAQDPPYYAEVLAFETGLEMDWAYIRLTDWHGWRHDRRVYFYHNGGPIVVVDEAVGTPGSGAALVWHFTGDGLWDGQRIYLRSGDDPAEALIAPLSPAGRVSVQGDGNTGRHVVYYDAADGRLRLATLFLLGQWAGAEVEFDAAEQALRITGSRASIVLALVSR